MTTGTAASDDVVPGELTRPARPALRPPRVAAAVAAARQVLEDEGAGALTMRRLADELGIRAPSLYKHFANKAAVELAVVEDAVFALGDVTHEALHRPGPPGPLRHLLQTYRAYCVAHPNLYRLATSGQFPRDDLSAGLEEWAGNPWFVVTRDPSLAQALWSFAHGMVILELDQRYPPGSDLDATWRAGADAFARAADSPCSTDRP